MSVIPFLARRSTLVAAGIVGLSAAFYGAPAHAQQSEIDVLRQQILELQNRLNDIEAAQKKTDTSVAAATKATSNTLTAKSPVAVSGLVQFHALGYFGDDDDTADTFRFRRGEIRFRAPRITDKISGTVMFDLAKTGRNANQSSGTVIGNERNSVLQEYVISYELNRNENSNLFLDLGQFKVPIGYEGPLVSSSALQTVERALFFRDGLNGVGGVSSSLRFAADQRDQGVALRGESGEFGYAVGIFNGLGERQNSVDFDDDKAIAGMIRYAPKNTGLNLGLSYGRGEISNFDLDPDNIFGTGVGDAERDIYNAFAAYRKDKITAQAEYFKAKANDDNVDLEADSYYGSIGYLFTPKVEGVLRYDVFDGESNTPDGDVEVKETTLGVNYYISRNDAKVQVNLVNRDTDDDEDGLQLRTNFQVAF